LCPYCGVAYAAIWNHLVNEHHTPIPVAREARWILAKEILKLEV
jgi:hypothetical protein